MNRLVSILAKILPTNTAYAHCDVPCGIYDATAARIAAATCLRMIEKIEALEHPEKHDKASHLNYDNTLTRMIWTKEEHARKCKEELLILWTDYFKPEHLEKYPNLHDTFWKAAKQCSKVKQEISKESAQALVKAVDEIAHIFEETKAAK